MEFDQVYQSNMKDPEGPSCFLDQSRVCGPDCMAYLTKPPEGSTYLGEQWAQCHLLVNAERLGKHVVILANVTNELFKIRKKQAEDTIRTNQGSPPGVR